MQLIKTSSSWRNSSLMLCPYENMEFRTRTRATEGEYHIKMKEKMGIIFLHVKKYQRWPAAGKRSGQIPYISEIITLYKPLPCPLAWQNCAKINMPSAVLSESGCHRGVGPKSEYRLHGAVGRMSKVNGR